MKTPVIAVTGFLGCGKTSFINKMMTDEMYKKSSIILFTFEKGEKQIENTNSTIHEIYFSKRELENDSEKVAKDMARAINNYISSEIWIEWNCMEGLSTLYNLLTSKHLRKLCSLEKILHISSINSIEGELSAGSLTTEQVSEASCIILNDVLSPMQLKSRTKAIKNINPGVKTIPAENTEEIKRFLSYEPLNTINTFIFAILCTIVLYLIAKSLLEKFNFFADMILVSFLGTMLKALPFLMLGVIISAFIQVFITTELMEKIFPKKLIPSMAVALLAGFFLPVCDCVSIPVFRTLVKKGVPIPAAVTFLLASPVINPIVMISTYSAFNKSIEMVLTRIILGIIVSVIVGLCFVLFPTEKMLLSNTFVPFCKCGCYDKSTSGSSFKDKFSLMISHSQAEFFDVGRYLIIGAFISSILSYFTSDFFTSQSNLPIAIILMMIMAFVLSLCSSSDAVIAKSLASSFPQGALMAFMVFGPMLDIKNIMMLNAGFPKRFIIRLAAITTIVSFIVILVAYV